MGVVMVQQSETRTDRLNRLSRLARSLQPVPIEDRARLERSEHLGNQAKYNNP
jgi:hypothetical protein